MKFKYLGLTVLVLSTLLVGCTKEEKKAALQKTETEEHQQHDEHNHINEEHSTHNHDHEHDHDDHNHNYDEDEEQKQIYKGYFEDSQVEDRPLSDWEGDWQSVYPYLLDGTLDEVFEHKASNSTSQTFEDIKNYYTIGYETTTERIVIEANMVTFYDHGHAHSGEYAYDGYEILTYEKGNRGVRFIFKHIGDDKAMPAYIQFSDHIIYPKKSDHFHLYWGNDREALLEEVTKWPTYYPSKLDGHSIAHEMMAH